MTRVWLRLPSLFRIAAMSLHFVDSHHLLYNSGSRLLSLLVPGCCAFGTTSGSENGNILFCFPSGDNAIVKERRTWLAIIKRKSCKPNVGSKLCEMSAFLWPFLRISRCLAVDQAAAIELGFERWLEECPLLNKIYITEVFIKNCFHPLEVNQCKQYACEIGCTNARVTHSAL